MDHVGIRVTVGQSTGQLTQTVIFDIKSMHFLNFYAASLMLEAVIHRHWIESDLRLVILSSRN